MIAINYIEEYNVVKYMRKKLERRQDESCERIPTRNALVVMIIAKCCMPARAFL